VTEKANKIK